MAGEIDTSQFRNGLKIEIDGEPFVIEYFQHVKPGKGSAFVRTKIRSLLSGRVLEPTMKSGDKVLVQVTATDVIHSWTVPSFAVKQDGVPGRIAQLWFSADKEGIYFGQCSELCGINHAYMPIVVKVVSPQVYADWLTRAKEEFSADAGPLPSEQPVRLAQAE